MKNSYRKFLRFINRTCGRYLILIFYYSKKFSRNFSFFKRKKEAKNSIRKILVIKLVGLGDTVLMLPSIRKLKDVYPGVKITALLTPLSSGILNNQAILGDIIIYDILGTQKGIWGFYKVVSELRKREFDLIIDYEQHFKLVTILSFLVGVDKIIGFDNPIINRGHLLTDRVLLDGNIHMLESFDSLLTPLGINTGSVKLEKINVPDTDIAYIDEWLKKQNLDVNDLRVGMHIVSGRTALSRRWPIERYAEIGDRLIEEFGAKVIFTGTLNERLLLEETADLMRNSPIISAGQTNIMQLVRLIDRVDLFVSNDTGPMHVGPAMGTPTIGLFGPNTPLRYRPFGSGHMAIYKKVDCSPCINIHNGEVPECGNPECMENITVDDVWQKIELLAGNIQKLKQGEKIL